MLWNTCACVALSAGAFGLYSRVEWPWFILGWVGFVPWLASLDRLKSWRQALLSGLMMSIAFVGAVFWWFIVGIAEYTGGGILFSALAVAVLAPLFQPQFIPVALVHRLSRHRSFAIHAFTVAATYCAAEWLVPKLFGDTIGHGFLASRHLRQAADVAGAPGLTFTLILANLCVLESWQRWQQQRDARAAVPVAVVATVIALLFVYGAHRLNELETAEARATKITAAVVQGNLSHYGDLAERMGTFDATRLILDSYFELSHGALAQGGVELLVWPETVYPTTFGKPKSAAGAELDAEISAFVAQAGVPLIFGAYDSNGSEEYNAAIFLDAASERVTPAAYRKGSLFPLTERVPWPFDTELVRSWWPWLGTWKPGDPPRVLRLAIGGVERLVAPLICYDAVDSQRALAAVNLGADIIVTMSNDSWFSAGGGPWLHLVVSAFRSLETRRSQVRATNTGISTFIAPTGDLIAGADSGERAAVVATLPVLKSPSTLMLAWGDWFGPASMLVAAILIATCVVPARLQHQFR